MLLDRKPSRSGLPRFRPSTQTHKQQPAGLLSPDQPVDRHSDQPPDASSPSRPIEQDFPHQYHTLPPLSSLSAIKHWFESTIPSPPSQAISTIPQSTPAPSLAKAVFPFVSPSPAQLKSTIPAKSQNRMSKLVHKATNSHPDANQSKSGNTSAGVHSPPTTTETLSASKHSLKPLGNSFRGRTPSSLFNRRLANAPPVKPKLVTIDAQKNKQPNPIFFDPNGDASLITHDHSKNSPINGQDKNTSSSAKSHPNKSLPTPKKKLFSPKNQAHDSQHKSALPPASVVAPASFPGTRSGESANALSLGIHYNPAPKSTIKPVHPHPTPLLGIPSPVNPGPRGSSLNPFANAGILPSTPHAVDQNFSRSRFNSRASTLTLASTCTGSDDDFGSSDLASIQLPSSPTDSFRPSIRSIDLLSDFPLPPSRDAFVPNGLDSAVVSHAPAFDIVEAHLPRRLNYSPSSPPQIPLPPLPPSAGSDLSNHPSLSYPDKTPTQPPTDGIAGSRPSTDSPTLLNSPDLSSTTYTIDDFLDLYQNNNSPAAPQTFMRLDRSPLLAADRKVSGSSSTSESEGFESMDPSTPHHASLLNADLPSRTTSPDHLSLEDFDNEDDHTLLTNNSRQTDHMASASDDEDATSEIDLNEPLGMMAVRLGYQLDIGDGSDSDNESDVRRNADFEDEDQLLDNGPPPSRGPSRQALPKFRSHSSLRSHFQPSRGRVTNRVVIAEASSSDEEEFDLQLDHQSTFKHARENTSPEISDEPQPKWRGVRNDQWKRSSFGSTGSFATTPSSNRSSYMTNFSTPNTTQAMNHGEPSSAKQTKGLVGLGFDMEVPAEGSSSSGQSRVDSIATQLPGKPGSSERREWLEQAFCKRDPPGHDQERSSSLPGLSKAEPKESPLLTPEVADGEETSEDQLTSLLAEGNRSARRLKPLMLVSRKDRRLSYPLISSTITEEDMGPLTAVGMMSFQSRSPARNSYSVGTPNSVSPATSRYVRTRTSLVNISYHRSPSTNFPLHPPRSSAV
ncbi:hypothetical protein MJO28_016608 [Puccinia striiformis f. sp. tritici]|uniref:Uncharacterized protein n=2 Tax=Puccinia striiformis f. sp. tritici TaxID=168172 RepID=A0A0L0UUK1_9BASI|nr:hypothetical protein MJO28_016608 [Puccinia striiformis f. sp. tritici]KAI9600354.1 hypothetical protein H4Q26_000134 [Puccinia striiformis f. sp. tritici PST-130]KNE90700.1 hypothetical protein PSTG_15852 [Puccinia striiformis f. sp. tritici PST-78]